MKAEETLLEIFNCDTLKGQKEIITLYARLQIEKDRERVREWQRETGQDIDGLPIKLD